MRAADGRGGSCKIVNISDAVAIKREQFDKWLDDKVAGYNSRPSRLGFLEFLSFHNHIN